MTVALSILGGLITVLVMVATWDEPNRWKAWSLIVAATVCAVGLRTVSFMHGYIDGRDDAVCEFVEAYEAKGIPIETEHVDC